MLNPYGSPYGAMLHNPRFGTFYPGTTTYTQNRDGRFVGADGPDKIISLQIRAWPIFDMLFPRLKKAILTNPGRCKPPELRKAIKDYESRIDAIREQRWRE